MKVFVLLRCWAYEGCDLIGVFSSHEKAQDYSTKEYKSGHDVIEEVEIDILNKIAGA